MTSSNPDPLSESPPFQELCAELFEANLLLHQGEAGGREGALKALCSVITFFRHVPQIGDTGLLVPLHLLADAVLALDNGHTRPMLRKRKLPHRAKANTIHNSMIALAAFSVTALTKRGMSTQEATKAVAECMNKGGANKQRGSRHITAVTVRHWCEQASFAGGPIYKEFCEFIEIDKIKGAPADMTNHRAQQWYLSQLVRQLERYRLPKVST
ncbi:MAG: hypothetical protein KGL48_03280 [Sphingomonadales bacterium]|nr:hypothetical protein [Sphingomonadales bacterium]MDE2570212.1 hypothetical protein [Sphingomonadales bacterium]